MIYLRAHFALKLSRILNGIITKSFYGSITYAKKHKFHEIQLINHLSITKAENMKT